MELTREVGTFWKYPDNLLHFLIMGTVGGKYQVVYFDSFDSQCYYAEMSESQTESFVPSCDLEINKTLIEELSKGGSQ